MKEEKIIKCPHCGREYLPCEIYLPDNFLGKAYRISHSEDGSIDFYDGANMELVETYTCDQCGKPFEVTADINFKVKAISEEEDIGYISVL